MTALRMGARSLAISRVISLAISSSFVMGCAHGDASPSESLAEGLAQLEMMQATVEISIDEAVASCMRRAGFDYVPTTPAPSTIADGLNGHEFREHFGYGISTITATSASSPNDDPNAAVLAGLDTAGNEAYLDAMFGPVDADPPQGCFNDARRHVVGPFDRFMTAHATELEGLWERVLSDPEVLEAQDAWSRCMAAQGIDAADPQGVRDQLSRRLAALDPGESALLAVLQAEERAIALVDERCTSRELDAVTERVLAGERQQLESAGSRLFIDLETLASSSGAGPP